MTSCRRFEANWTAAPSRHFGDTTLQLFLHLSTWLPEASFVMTLGGIFCQLKLAKSQFWVFESVHLCVFSLLSHQHENKHPSPLCSAFAANHFWSALAWNYCSVSHFSIFCSVENISDVSRVCVFCYSKTFWYLASKAQHNHLRFNIHQGGGSAPNSTTGEGF